MKFFALFTMICLYSCSPAQKFKTDKPLFDSSKVLMHFKSIADMNDAYFVVKENNFFEFYRQLFDSLKNSSYPGKYTKHGDTLILHFYDKKGVKLLGNKAMINEGTNQIVFFK